jgi:AGCS family alanine or glycine:cation symporter
MGGIQLTQNALQSQVGNLGTTFVAIAIFLFAFSSIIGNYTYGEMNVRFLSNKKIWLFLLRLMNGAVMVYFGAIASLELAWSLGDLFMGLVTLCNLIAIVMLGKHCFFLLDDYINQKRKGIKSPTFNRKQIPEIESDLDCWEE